MSNIFCSNINDVSWLKSIPILKNGEIHIHCFYLPDSVASLENFFYLLSEDEKIKAGKYRQVNDRNLYVIGKIATKLLLSVYHKCAPEEIEIVRHKNEKPRLKILSNTSQSVVSNFNISHSKNILLVAISKHEVGVDVEKIIKLSYGDVMQISFTVDEINFVKNSWNSPLAFSTIWTRKEALLKANGAGIIDELSALQVLDGINAVTLDVFKNKDYSVISFPVDELYTGSISYESLNKKELKFIKTNLSQFI